MELVRKYTMYDPPTSPRDALEAGDLHPNDGTQSRHLEKFPGELLKGIRGVLELGVTREQLIANITLFLGLAEIANDWDSKELIEHCACVIRTIDGDIEYARSLEEMKEKLRTKRKRKTGGKDSSSTR
jgi:hypothetical protein